MKALLVLILGFGLSACSALESDKYTIDDAYNAAVTAKEVCEIAVETCKELKETL